MIRWTNKFGLVLVAALVLYPSERALAQYSGEVSAKQKMIASLKEVGNAGDPNAQVQLGVIYLTGDGVAKDYAEALKWFRKAAEQDQPLAERYLAEMYFKGRGVTADNAEAAKWLRMAAEQGDAQSQHNLAVLYLQGLGVPRNLKLASSWMVKSAQQNLAAGQLDLGVLYENGEGVPLDLAKAARWYQKAADQNNSDAMSNLARIMATSKTPGLRNPPQAIVLATKAIAVVSKPDYLDALAAAYSANGENDKAIDAERKALLGDPGNELYKQALQKYLSAAHTN